MQHSISISTQRTRWLFDPLHSDLTQLVQLSAIHPAQQWRNHDALNGSLHAGREIPFAPDRHTTRNSPFYGIHRKRADKYGWFALVRLHQHSPRLRLRNRRADRLHHPRHARLESDDGARTDPTTLNREIAEILFRQDARMPVMIIRDEGIDRFRGRGDGG